jgi:hypothetical protein
MTRSQRAWQAQAEMRDRHADRRPDRPSERRRSSSGGGGGDDSVRLSLPDSSQDMLTFLSTHLR